MSGEDTRKSWSSWSSSSVCFEDCNEGEEDLIVSGDEIVRDGFEVNKAEKTPSIDDD